MIAPRSIQILFGFDRLLSFFGSSELTCLCRFINTACLEQSVIWQAVVSYFFTFGFIVLGVFLIAQARLHSAATAAIVIRIINYSTPFLCSQINNRLEKRTTEGGRQASLYVKMTLFKWVSTAVGYGGVPSMPGFLLPQPQHGDRATRETEFICGKQWNGAHCPLFPMTSTFRLIPSRSFVSFFLAFCCRSRRPSFFRLMTLFKIRTD